MNVWTDESPAYSRRGRGLNLHGCETTRERQSPAVRPTPVVFVVDDDLSVRESLEMLIRSEGWRPELCVSAGDFLGRPQVPAPSCLLLDVSLPDINGLELQRRVAADRAEMPIIVITGHGDVPMTVTAMKAGAVEFLTKPFDTATLVAAIGHAIERSEAAMRELAHTRTLLDRYQQLTPRECKVMEMVVAGLLNKQVGAELGISEITVKAHRGSAMRKMRADSLAQLVTMAARLRAVRPTG